MTDEQSRELVKAISRVTAAINAIDVTITCAGIAFIITFWLAEFGVFK